MPLRLALAVRETVTGRRLGALEGINPPSSASPVAPRSTSTPPLPIHAALCGCSQPPPPPTRDHRPRSSLDLGRALGPRLVPWPPPLSYNKIKCPLVVGGRRAGRPAPAPPCTHAPTKTATSRGNAQRNSLQPTAQQPPHKPPPKNADIPLPQRESNGWLQLTEHPPHRHFQPLVQ